MSRPTSPSPLLLGVDAGGSKIELWLARLVATPRISVLGRGRAAIGNLAAVGAEVALGHAQQAVAAAFADAAMPLQPVAACAVMAAGTGDEAVRQTWHRWAGQFTSSQCIRVVHDAVGVLRAGCPAGQGVALIAGTGSLCYGVSASGKQERAGGWGYLLGDEGSGFAIGLAALQAVCQATDGRQAAGTLRRAVMDRFKLSDARQLVPRLVQPTVQARQIAALAPIVFQLAAEGDAAAESIVARGAQDLAALVLAVVDRLQPIRGALPLALAGGVLVGQPEYAHEVVRLAVTDGRADRDLRFGPVSAVHDPVGGAVMLAADLVAPARDDPSVEWCIDAPFVVRSADSNG